MGFFDLFRRKPPIGSREALADFIDSQAAFLAQKGIYEYSRARAGPFSKMLFAESAFLEAVNRARWQAYPLALIMVGEIVEGVLRPHAPAEGSDALDVVVELTLVVFDRYPPPAPLPADAWSEARAEVARRLKGIALHPVKPARDIPAPYASSYMALMPIHEKLRGEDLPTLHNYLKVTLCNIHAELVARADPRSLVAELAGPR